MPCPPLWDLPDPGIKQVSPEQAGRFFTSSATWEAPKKTQRWSRDYQMYEKMLNAISKMRIKHIRLVQK